MSTRLCPPLRPALAALLWLLGGTAGAQSGGAPLALPDPYVPSPAVRFGEPAPRPDADAESGAGSRAPLTLRPSMLSGARLVEMPSDAVPGRYARPKYALGFRSQAMKSFAQGLGLDADTCLLPLVRARTSISQGGDVSGRVMVFARCSFY